MTRIASCCLLMMAEMISAGSAQAKLDAPRAAPRIVLSVFQSGQVIVFDAETGRALRAIPSRDGGGISAIAISPSDGTLIIVDESLQSRLRLFDAKTFSLFEGGTLCKSRLKLQRPSLAAPVRRRQLAVSLYL